MHKIHLPRLGQTMERGTILRWFKAEGESYEIGESLYEVETEKVVNEIEAKLPGILCRILVSADEEHPVGTLLAVAADPGENPTPEEVEAEISAETGEAAREKDESGSATSSVDERAETPPSGDRSPGSRVRAMPKARSLAREFGVDLASIEGTGKGGSITANDVRRAAECEGGRKKTAEEATVSERRPLSGVGRTMARTVSRSWSEVPQFVQMVELDASKLVERRQRLLEKVEREQGFKLSYTDLFLEALVAAIREQPLANAAFSEEEIMVYEDVNVSVAVDTEAGLLVPVLHKAQQMSLGERAAALRELADRARAGRLTSGDFEGGTITLSNLGMHGIEGGTPLVTSPQAAVVFVGAMVERPWVVEGEIVPRPTISVSVGFDHRILDGVSAARFTTAFRQALAAG